MRCPECGKELGKGSEIDFTHIGWVCSNHKDYEIKIIKELSI